MKPRIFQFDMGDALPVAEPAPVEMVLNVKVPAELAESAIPSVREAIQRALELAVSRYAMGNQLIFDADRMAQMMVANASPTVELVEERAGRLKTIQEIQAATRFLTGDSINEEQTAPKQNKHAVASDWKRRGRIFSVTGADGKEYYPLYQFDMNYRPLPLVKEILAALGEQNDPWAIAAWFHYPNGWISTLVDGKPVALAPKDALLARRDDVLKAARHEKGSHIA